MPDDTTLEIVLTYLQKPEYAKGYILDGFPRTVVQAEAFNGSIEKVIYINVSAKEALWRISGREQLRDDETLTAIRKRIELFFSVTMPVVDYYRNINKLVEIDGEVSVDEVFATIVSKLEQIK